MADDPAHLATLVLRQVAELLAALPATELRALAAGQAHLAVVAAAATPAEPARPAAPARTAPARTAPARSKAARPRSGRAGKAAAVLDPLAARAAIMALDSRAAATEHVLGLGPIPVLKQLADALGIRLSSSDLKADIARRIVDATLGLRLTADAMRQPST